jgi:hypothetical protein
MCWQHTLSVGLQAMVTVDELAKEQHPYFRRKVFSFSVTHSFNQA